MSIKIFRNGVPLVQEVNLMELSSGGDDVEVHILDEPFTITFNMPWITSITLPSSILATCYIYPSKIELQCANPNETTYVWYKGKKVRRSQYPRRELYRN